MKSLPKISYLFLLLFVVPFSVSVNAQTAADNETDSTKIRQIKPGEEEDFCRKTGDRIFDEMLVKQCIKNQQKEYNELLSNGEEAAKLSAELVQSFDKSPAMGAQDQKKLERVEKLFKKIRNSLGAEEDTDIATEDDKPMTVKAAFVALSERATSLVAELKKTTRHSVSVIAIQSSNAVIKLVKFIRFGRK